MANFGGGVVGGSGAGGAGACPFWPASDEVIAVLFRGQQTSSFVSPFGP
jgi:hypothetical protein